MMYLPRAVLRAELLDLGATVISLVPRTGRACRLAQHCRPHGARVRHLELAVGAPPLASSSESETRARRGSWRPIGSLPLSSRRSEEHTSELQSRGHLVCRLLLEKKKRKQRRRADHGGKRCD